MLSRTYLVYVLILCLARRIDVAYGESAERRPTPTFSKPTPRIAIIGSGMAGASVAWRLAHDTDQVDITVFEADDRIGGRLDEVTVHGKFEAGVKEKLIELGGTMGIEANRSVSSMCI